MFLVIFILFSLSFLGLVVFFVIRVVNNGKNNSRCSSPTSVRCQSSSSVSRKSRTTNKRKLRTTYKRKSPSSRKRKSYLPSGFEAIYFDYPEREWSHEKDKRGDYDPYDNHWESSFDWQDEDGDGYDDRDDGFWNEREF